jgi:hypothetical protein
VSKWKLLRDLLESELGWDMTQALVSLVVGWHNQTWIWGQTGLLHLLELEPGWDSGIGEPQAGDKIRAWRHIGLGCWRATGTDSWEPPWLALEWMAKSWSHHWVTTIA